MPPLVDIQVHLEIHDCLQHEFQLVEPQPGVIVAVAGVDQTLLDVDGPAQKKRRVGEEPSNQTGSFPGEN